jgi:hypothetical protein
MSFGKVGEEAINWVKPWKIFPPPRPEKTGKTDEWMSQREGE